MIQKTHFLIKQNKEELFCKNASNGDFRCLYADSESLIAGKLPWHWHTAFEIDYIAGCDVTFCFAGDTFSVSHGSAVFINSGEIHSYVPECPQNFKIYAILFEPVFLSGNYGNGIFEKYIAPVTNTNISSLLLSREAPEAQKPLSKIERMIQLCATEPDYYELLLRSELDICWCYLMDSLKKETSFLHVKAHDSERIRSMLHYIHAHYDAKISLDDIACAAAISTRECSRCFQRSIHCSPMEYLVDYRLRTSIQQLTTTSYSITQISENCGFSSLSYFGKVFKQHIGMSPVQYRISVLPQKTESRQERK